MTKRIISEDKPKKYFLKGIPFPIIIRGKKIEHDKQLRAWKDLFKYGIDTNEQEDDRITSK